MAFMISDDISLSVEAILFLSGGTVMIMMLNFYAKVHIMQRAFPWTRFLLQIE